jgi:hypothetical protein
MNKIRKVVFASGLFLMALCNSTFAQYSVGDMSPFASGVWTTTNVNWNVWNGSSWVGAPAAPTCNDNVIIISPFTIQVVFGTVYHCKNLTVEAGAKLWAGQSTANQETYIAIADCPGNNGSIVCDGMIGDNGVTNDNISFDIDGVICDISGTGTFDAARMRKKFVVNPTTSLTINMPVNLRYPSSTQLYSEGTSTAATTFNVTVNKYLKLVTGNASIDGTDGQTQVSAFNQSGTVTINDTMEVQNILYLTTNNTLINDSCSWVINGQLKVYQVNAPASTNGRVNLSVNNGGLLNLTGTPAFFAPLSAVNNKFYFYEGSTVQYSALGAQSVQPSGNLGGGFLNQYYNLLITGSGNKTITTAALSVRHDITISNSTGTPTLAAGTFNISLGGNWTNYQGGLGYTFTPTGGFSTQVAFARNPLTLVNQDQYITCPGGEKFCSLFINKQPQFTPMTAAIATTVFLNNDVSVDSILQFTSFDSSALDLNGHTLTLKNRKSTAYLGSGAFGSTTYGKRYIISETEAGADLTQYAYNPSIMRWVIGTAASSTAGKYVFPFGARSTSAYFPLTISKKATAAADTLSAATRAASLGSSNRPWDTTLTLPPYTPYVSSMNSLFVGVSPAADSNTVDRWWELGYSGAPYLLVDSVVFSYRGAENTLDPAYRNLPLKAQNWTGTGWDKGITQACTYCTNGVTVGIGTAVMKGIGAGTGDTIGTFQPWVLTSVSHPLPIKLLYFTAKLNGEKVDVNWATASETNNKYFYVERSKDGNAFKDIGILNGAGNSTTTLYYSYVDQNPYTGVSYYRLRQEDYDGAVSHSDIVSVLNNNKGSSWMVYPNPAKDIIRIENIGSDAMQNASFNLFNPEGVLVKTISLGSKNNSVRELDIRDLSNGIYIGRIADDYNQQVFKIVKN